MELLLDGSDELMEPLLPESVGDTTPLLLGTFELIEPFDLGAATGAGKVGTMIVGETIVGPDGTVGVVAGASVIPKQQSKNIPSTVGQQSPVNPNDTHPGYAGHDVTTGTGAGTTGIGAIAIGTGGIAVGTGATGKGGTGIGAFGVGTFGVGTSGVGTMGVGTAGVGAVGILNDKLLSLCNNRAKTSISDIFCTLRRLFIKFC